MQHHPCINSSTQLGRSVLEHHQDMVQEGVPLYWQNREDASSADPSKFRSLERREICV